MSAPKKRRVQGGRVTPKGTQPRNQRSIETVQELDDTPSEPWVAWLLFAFLGLGVLVIFLNYVKLVPGGETHNGFTLLGLGFILAGIITATRLK